jgi:hypothetical protein
LKHCWLTELIYRPIFGGNDGRNTLRLTDLSKVPAKQFSDRLSMLLNTYYMHALGSNIHHPAATCARYSNATPPVRDMDMFAQCLPTSLTPAT